MASETSLSPITPNLSQNEVELQRKRARDRKSQQAMRDRTKWTLQTLSAQVSALSQALDQRTKEFDAINTKISQLETENEHLRVENAALRLQLMTDKIQQPKSLEERPAWEQPTNNVPPTCLADEILQSFVESRRQCGAVERAAAYSRRPNFCSMLDKTQRSEDEISNVVADVIGSYHEIETLPKQVAVHYNMSALLRWMVLLDEWSFTQMPDWLRPTKAQLSTPHAGWIDRIPWPKAREYLVAHPEITLDHFAATYSSSFYVRWDYDPSHVLIITNRDNTTREVIINPIYEEHIRQLRNWSVGDGFRNNFPAIAKLIDENT